MCAGHLPGGGRGAQGHDRHHRGRRRRRADLADCCLDLQHLFAKHGYHEAIIFGHALEGNVHFVFTQDFGIESEVARYAAFMDEVCTLLVSKYDGSLKAEHGTGRNMAPFVELEWGAQAYALMKEIKRLFDPEDLLNPGVIINDDAEAHLKHLKPMPAAGALYAPVDRCIECGFCEPQCPSHGLTLSPRQRIVGWRELSRRKAAGETGPGQDYLYMGLDTRDLRPVRHRLPAGIETGALTHAGAASCRTSHARSAASPQPFRRHPGAGPHRPEGRAPGRGGDRHGAAVAPERRRLEGRHAQAAAGERPRPAPARATRSSISPPAPAACSAPTRLRRVVGDGDRVLERAGYVPIVPAGVDAVLRQSFASKGARRDADRKSAELGRAAPRQRGWRVSDRARRQRLLAAHEDFPRRSPAGVRPRRVRP